MQETAAILQRLDVAAIERIAAVLAQIKAAAGRIFFLGVGGSAGNCSHAVNDFRKLAGIECYAPTDNVSELTARINDDGWESTFVEWLKVSRLDAKDAVFILSVGGGSTEANMSLEFGRRGQLRQGSRRQGHRHTGPRRRPYRAGRRRRGDRADG